MTSFSPTFLPVICQALDEASDMDYFTESPQQRLVFRNYEYSHFSDGETLAV